MRLHARIACSLVRVQSWFFIALRLGVCHREMLSSGFEVSGFDFREPLALHAGRHAVLVQLFYHFEHFRAGCDEVGVGD
jgi:hypothetical protein